jgi:hypothetical protein
MESKHTCKLEALHFPRTSQFAHAFRDICVIMLTFSRPHYSAGDWPTTDHQHGLATMHHATPLEMGLALPGPLGIPSGHK